jgi:hypothetical protein
VKKRDAAQMGVATHMPKANMAHVKLTNDLVLILYILHLNW